MSALKFGKGNTPEQMHLQRFGPSQSACSCGDGGDSNEAAPLLSLRLRFGSVYSKGVD